ncbi:MAG TPA: DUF6748 domain-containing protein [Kofleriaceae bacterium]|nr:DUF6748 domain-containing protein [Kofleriaceae bacterium]
MRHSSLLAAPILLVGCAVADTPGDDLSSSDDAVASVGTVAYFQITRDLRKCQSPTCGGFFLERLNHATTRCNDGRYRTRCYSSVLDWTDAHLSADDQAILTDAAASSAAIVRGHFAPPAETLLPEIGRFLIGEAWVAEGDGVAAGTFVRVIDNGVRCITAPCPHLAEATLETTRKATISDVDFTTADMTASEIEACNAELAGSDGILIAGDRYYYTENGRVAVGRTVNLAFGRLAPVR